jgi:SAM-dependent methyltransferase
MSRRPFVSPGDYHLAELKIALDRGDPAHSLPPPMPVACRILDVGCGAGQTLIAAYPDRISFGLDIDCAALKLGRSLTDRVCFACGAIEALPYREAQFDLVVARVSLPYTNLAASLGEIRRVLKTGGRIWMTLHDFSLVWNQAKRSGLRGAVFFAYILLNSALFHFTGRQFPFLGRYESFQTERGIIRALRRNRFDGISIARRGGIFQVTATVVSADEEPAAMATAAFG